MKIVELVEAAKAANPKAFGTLKDARTAKMVTLVLREIVKQIDSTSEGRVVIAGLGMFKIAQIDREVDGKKVRQKRVIFRRSIATAKPAFPVKK